MLQITILTIILSISQCIFVFSKISKRQSIFKHVYVTASHNICSFQIVLYTSDKMQLENLERNTYVLTKYIIYY